ncbi:hypothetical protein [Anaeromyxobacter terrae]|uniref:hypothetical protein n=1 Tax=Anaeromyxobacter terrae TaxID=2925406 RepID=UPI001F588908|nr:hypothetical protein [Anaeromyxobacter sp. SG22]
MRYLLVASSLLLGSLTSAPSAQAQVSVGVGIAMPSIQIGINVPAYPELVAVPGYPVYYAPRASSNYFFYDGAYWVLQGDDWYVSSWYDGPWYVVQPEHVPLYVLRVPVRYYRQPPPYFRGWRADAPPRWGQHWGRDWEGRRRGWDRWDRHGAPRPAPLPVYQRGYAGDRYPRAPEMQREIRSEHYRYRPREEVTRTRFEPYEGPGRGPPRAEPYPQGPDHRRWSGPPPRDDRRGDDRRGNDGRGNDRRGNDPGPHDNGQRHGDEGRGRGHDR